MRRLTYSIILLPLLLFMIIAIFLWRGLSQDPQQIPSALLNHSVPAFTAENLLNPRQPITQTIFLGHVTLLNVFASWCVMCRLEHPLLMDIADVKDLQVIGLNYKDQRSKVLVWLQHYGNPYQHIIYDHSGQLAINLGVYGTPETFIIDQHARIRYKYTGVVSEMIWKDELLPEIEKLQG